MPDIIELQYGGKCITLTWCRTDEFTRQKGVKSKSRIPIPSLNDAPAASKPTLDAVHEQIGVVPNLYGLISSGTK